MPRAPPLEDSGSDSTESLPADPAAQPRPSRWQAWAEQQAEQQRWHRLRQEHELAQAAERRRYAEIRAREEAFYAEQRALAEQIRREAAAEDQRLRAFAAFSAQARTGLSPAYVQARQGQPPPNPAAGEALEGSTGETLSASMSTAGESIVFDEPLLASDSGSTAQTNEAVPAPANFAGAVEQLQAAAALQEVFPNGVPADFIDWFYNNPQSFPDEVEEAINRAAAAQHQAAQEIALAAQAELDATPEAPPPVPPPSTRVDWHDFFQEERRAEQEAAAQPQTVFAAAAAAAFAQATRADATAKRRPAPSQAPGLAPRTRTRGKRGGERHRFHNQVVDATPAGQRQLDPRETKAAFKALKAAGAEPGRLPQGAVGWVRGSFAGPAFHRPDLPDIPEYKGFPGEWEEGADDAGAPSSGNESDDSEDYRHPQRDRAARRHRPFVPALHRDDETADPNVAEGVVDARGLRHRDFLGVDYETVVAAAGLTEHEVRLADRSSQRGTPTLRPRTELRPGAGSSSSSSSSSWQPSSSSSSNWQEARGYERGGGWEGQWQSQSWDDNWQCSDRHWPQEAEEERQRPRAPDDYSPEAAFELLEWSLEHRDCGSFAPIISFDWYGVLWVPVPGTRSCQWNLAALESAREFRRAGWSCVVCSFASKRERQEEIRRLYLSELPAAAPARICTDLFDALHIVPDKIGRRGKAACLQKYGNRIKAHIDDHPLDYYQELQFIGVACLGVWNGASRWPRGFRQWRTVTAAAKDVLQLSADFYGAAGPADRNRRSTA